VTFDEIVFNSNGLMSNLALSLQRQDSTKTDGFGFNRKFTKQINVDFGYQMQINTRKENMVNQLNNCIMFNFFINL